MRIRSVTRGSPAGDAVYCAAYRGGRRLWSERTGELYKHDGRRDVRDARIVLPRRFAGDHALDWARDPYRLWNTAEFSETQRNARVARDYMIVLPEALPLKQQVNLVHEFTQRLADRYDNAIDVALHDSRVGRARYPHAHLLATTRRVSACGLLEKTDAELAGEQRRSRGITHSYQDEQQYVRDLWEDSLSAAMQRAGLSPQVYFALGRQAGQGESTSEYQRRLVREGFDLAQQQRSDRQLQSLTATERGAAAARQWDIRQHQRLQDAARLERQRQPVQGERCEERGLRTDVPRWHISRGLLPPADLRPHLSRVNGIPGVSQRQQPQLLLQDHGGPARVCQAAWASLQAGWLAAREVDVAGPTAQNALLQSWLMRRLTTAENLKGNCANAVVDEARLALVRARAARVPARSFEADTGFKLDLQL